MLIQTVPYSMTRSQMMPRQAPRSAAKPLASVRMGANPNRRGFLGAVGAGMGALLLGNKAEASFFGALRDEVELEGMRRSARTPLAPDSTELSNHWPTNTAVYAGCIQDKCAFTEKDDGAFTRRLTKPLIDRDEKITSLDGAMRALKDGWKDSRDHLQVPVMTPKKPEETGWKIQENGKVERYAVLISGEGALIPTFNMMALDAMQAYNDTFPGMPLSMTQFDQDVYDWIKNSGEEDAEAYAEAYKRSFDRAPRNKLFQEDAFENDVDSMKKALIRGFDMPREVAVNRVPTDPHIHMVHLHKPSAKLLKQVLSKWLAPKQGKNAEVVVFYAGHGGIHKVHPTSRAEGADEGKLYIQDNDPVIEPQLKGWFQKYLAKFRNVTVIADSCHSGALVATAPDLAMSGNSVAT